MPVEDKTNTNEAIFYRIEYWDGKSHYVEVENPFQDIHITIDEIVCVLLKTDDEGRNIWCVL